MSYADDPVTYSTNAQGQTVATWTGGPNPGTFVYEQDQPNGNYGWDKIVTATPTGPIAPPAPTPVAPHLQFSNATIGSNIFLMYGDCRLPGQIAWAPGIDATNNVLDTSFLTFMTVYGEPLDPSESVEIASMSANGTTFYQSGGVVTVDNLSADAQAALATSVATMAVYTGSETQLPDPTMEDYLGVGNVPAYRGLRYIVFQDFPIEITNGAVPNIIVEWRRTGGLLNVSDVMAKLINRVNWRSQYAQSRATIFFGAPTIDGIDDLCQGIQVTSQSSLLDHLNNHRNLYNFQIKEENPVKVVRRAVASDLVIDISVNFRVQPQNLSFIYIFILRVVGAVAVVELACALIPDCIIEMILPVALGHRAHFEPAGIMVVASHEVIQYSNGRTERMRNQIIGIPNDPGLIVTGIIRDRTTARTITVIG